MHRKKHKINRRSKDKMTDKEKMKEIIKNMSDRDRLVMKLRFEENKSVEEIAKELKINVPNCEDLITNILAGIRERLSK